MLKQIFSQHHILNELAGQVEIEFLSAWVCSRHTDIDSTPGLLDSFGAHIGGGEL